LSPAHTTQGFFLQRAAYTVPALPGAFKRRHASHETGGRRPKVRIRVLFKRN
jgi:hypothetical protein